MTAAQTDVIGIGNAIVDILAHADDAVLQKLDLAKGHMRLIDEAEVGRIYAAMGPAVEISGGSAANTIAGVASFGGRGAFIGRVADDDFGKVFRHDIRSIGVAFDTAPAGSGSATARCLVLVTPDGQRTMSTFLGAAAELGPDDVAAGPIEAAAITYLEGYLFDRPEAKAAFKKAAAIARKAQRKVAISLSDGFCVERHRADFLELIRSSIDIVLANTQELETLYQAPFEEACSLMAADAPLAAVTRSEHGSVILSGAERIAVAAEPIARLVDTTGAGDLYAAGFLTGIARGLPLPLCGQLGSIAAAEVIQHLGARPEQPLAALSRKKTIAI
ncbi:MAG: adenosine kinase [Hyphomicrobiaceae bacterium]